MHIVLFLITRLFVIRPGVISTRFLYSINAAKVVNLDDAVEISMNDVAKIDIMLD